MKKSIQVVFENDCGNEELICTRCIRHGKEGWKVSRYTKSLIVFEMIWDEHYAFYNTLEEVAVAFESGDYTTGRKDFNQKEKSDDALSKEQINA